MFLPRFALVWSGWPATAIIHSLAIKATLRRVPGAVQPVYLHTPANFFPLAASLPTANLQNLLRPEQQRLGLGDQQRLGLGDQLHRALFLG